MAFLIQDFIKTMERMAPAALAEEWDNVGLQAGGRGDGVDRVMVALGVTPEVLAEARAAGCGLILTHHPLIFAPVASLSDDSETGRLVRAAHEAGIAIFAAHTNLDAAPGGLADVAAELLGLLSPKPLAPVAAGRSKLVTFVPEADLERVKAGQSGVFCSRRRHHRRLPALLVYRCRHWFFSAGGGSASLHRRDRPR